MHDDDPFDRAARRETQLRRQGQVMTVAQSLLRHLEIGVSSRTLDDGIEERHVMGISTLDAATLRRAVAEGRKLRLRVAGILVVSGDVDDDLWQDAVDDMRVAGAVVGLKGAGERATLHIGAGTS